MAKEEKVKLTKEEKKAIKEAKKQEKEAKKNVVDVSRPMTIEDLASGLVETNKNVATIANALAKMVENVSPAGSSHIKVAETAPETKEKFTPKLDDETYPQDYMPPAYRRTIDEVLSPEFGGRVVNFDDRTDFMIEIVVPKKYSSVPKEEQDKGVEDIRSKMVSRALGVNGVREWCELVRKNLAKFYAHTGTQSPFRAAE